MKLQHITDDGVLVNLHPFGQALHEFIYSKEVFALLEPYGHGWLDGGCWTLAQALRLWSNGILQLQAVLTIPMQTPSHVVAHINGVYLDGDGLATADELLTKMRELEGVRNCVLGDFSEDTAIFIACYLPVIKSLVKMLHATFHEFDVNLLAPSLAVSIEEALQE